MFPLHERGGAGGEREADGRRFLVAATAVVLRERSSFRGGDHDGDGRRFLVDATAAVVLKRSSDGGRFLVAATAFLVAATAVVRRNCDGDNGRRFLGAATAVVLSERPSSRANSSALATRTCLLRDPRASSDELTMLELLLSRAGRFRRTSSPNLTAQAAVCELAGPGIVSFFVALSA